jgi:1-deoxy-D-xylulose-5-phosphate reductoisomerase
MTGVAVLGSTGSIGRQTLEVIAGLGPDVRVLALAAGRDSDTFATQLAAHPGARAWCAAGRPASASGRWADGGLEELATLEGVELVVVATTGMAALPAVLAALRAGRRVALANKETLVTGGHLVSAALDAAGGDALDRLRPVDSEHSAIWQCLAGEDMDSVKRLVLTASGGALRDLPLSALGEITPEKALAHPNWSMGRKITVDSATLFNKGLEVIEAHWLFDIPYEQIDVVMHRESVIHSMVEFVDGSLKAQLSSPDMRQPIQYALSYPRRLPLGLPSVDFVNLQALRFEALDMERYACLGLALAAANRGGTYPAALAAVDEEAVNAFLGGRLGFLDIQCLLSDTLAKHVATDDTSFEAVLDADAWGREFATAWIGAH